MTQPNDPKSQNGKAPNGKAPDDNDRHRDGSLPNDPREGTERVGKPVPRVLTVKDLLNISAEHALSKDKTSTHTTTHYILDDVTGGLRPGFAWLIGADTSYGKSSFLIAIADDNIKANKRVLIVSSEDTEDVYGDRLMVRRARVNAKRYRDQNLNNDEKKKVIEVRDKGEPVPVYIDARRWEIENLEPHLKAVIKQQAIDVVAFDYVQEFRSKRRWQDERVKYREIASICRHVAKDAKIAGIIMSQLTLDQNTRIPTRRNIRECRDIANASEVILIGFEPSTDLKDPKTGQINHKAGSKCILVDKVKNGPKGKIINMQWSEEHACFDTVKDPEREMRDKQAQEYGDMYGRADNEPDYDEYDRDS